MSHIRGSNPVVGPTLQWVYLVVGPIQWWACPVVGLLCNQSNPTLCGSHLSNPTQQLVPLCSGSYPARKLYVVKLHLTTIPHVPGNDGVQRSQTQETICKVHQE